VQRLREEGAVVKALSILQPYAWLIVQGIKPVENRTWYTGYRGPVLIHAGKTYSKRDHLDDWETWQHFCYPHERDGMIGGIVGIATITGCVDKSDSKWFNGPWGFTLTNAIALPKLVPMRGALGFFDVPADVLAQLPQEWLK
jgi:hypothetical protein